MTCAFIDCELQVILMTCKDVSCLEHSMSFGLPCATLQCKCTCGDLTCNTLSSHRTSIQGVDVHIA